MIYLHTGLPGAGKTLFTLHIVRERARKENRAVYYHGIELLKPEEFEGWVKLEDASKWYELPDGAIIVHDEAQTLYRPRGNGAQVPQYVAELETHRHKGHDLYFITQHPMLIDSNVRRLAGEHMHVVRSFGAKVATLHRWAQCKEQCDKSRADSIRETVGYPAALFEAYKSATLHTHKARVPKRVFLLMAMPFVFIGLVWGFYSWWKDFGAVAPDASATAPGAAGGAPGAAAAPGAAPGSASPRRESPRKTTAEWIAERQPRIEGLAHTAPVYDGVTTVVEAPRPAVCVASASRCVCYSQQSTRLQVADALCRQIADQGYFVDWDVSRASQRTRDDERPGQLADTAGRGRGGREVGEEGRGEWVAEAQGRVPSVIADSGPWGGIPPLGR